MGLTISTSGNRNSSKLFLQYSVQPVRGHKLHVWFNPKGMRIPRNGGLAEWLKAAVLNKKEIKI